MEFITLDNIINAVDGEKLVEGNIHKFNKVSTDSRKIEKDSIFIALKGDNFNGNNYITEASNKGAALCIIDEVNFEPKNLNPSTSIIKVKDTKKSLLDLAKYYRSTLDLKIIGITGSTGKTTTKDMTCSLLSEKFKVFKTKGNFNNEIGLPLMIFNLDNSYDIAILEMGMSNFGEIHNMTEAAVPDIAIITNVGVSHIENLKTRKNILKSKLEITDFFNSGSTLILNVDNDLLMEESKKDVPYKVIKTGTEKTADIKATNIKYNENSISFDIVTDNKLVYSEFKLNVPGKHNVLNALLAIVCGKIFNMSYEEMQNGIKNLSMTSMRLDIVKGEKFTIIDDCYNASPDSIKAAIDVLKSIKGNRKIAVLGTMRELGEDSYNLHKEVSSYAKDQSVDVLITLGEFSNAYGDGFENNKNFKTFEDIDKINEFLNVFIKKDDIILVKASRAMKFEKIVEALKLINN